MVLNIRDITLSHFLKLLSFPLPHKQARAFRNRLEIRRLWPTLHGRTERISCERRVFRVEVCGEVHGSNVMAVLRAGIAVFILVTTMAVRSFHDIEHHAGDHDDGDPERKSRFVSICEMKHAKEKRGMLAYECVISELFPALVSM